MDVFIQQVINGLTLGAVYAMVALGYTMVYGIIQLINFAHGEVVMVGAMVGSRSSARSRPRGFRRSPSSSLRPVRDPGVHADRLRDGAGGVPAPAGRAAACAPDHRDRRVDHLAAPGDADLEPQPARLSADHQGGVVPLCRATITSVQIAILSISLAMMADSRLSCIARARHRNARDRA